MVPVIQYMYWNDKELEMNFTLITSKGKVLTFFVKSVAETYQQIYGGTLVTSQIFTKEIENVYKR